MIKEGRMHDHPDVAKVLSGFLVPVLHDHTAYRCGSFPSSNRDEHREHKKLCAYSSYMRLHDCLRYSWNGGVVRRVVWGQHLQNTARTKTWRKERT